MTEHEVITDVLTFGHKKANDPILDVPVGLDLDIIDIHQL
jgi:hypothetical protein